MIDCTKSGSIYWYCRDHRLGAYRPASIQESTLANPGHWAALQDEMVFKGVEIVDFPGEPFENFVLPLETLLF